MNIAFLACDKKKELLSNFCLAYKELLKKHKLFATGTTGSVIIEATGLDVYLFSPGMLGGVEQICARVAYNEIDMVIFFVDPLDSSVYENHVISLLNQCDLHTIPFATNLATAEILIRSIDSDDMEWRSIQK